MAVTTTLETAPDVDVYADLTVWCTDLECPADVVDGFCAACGAQDHEAF
ncbi:hypothetical protein GCM10023169_30350 [Georgenia halophila]|uniref:Uncharacterized protein n=1 Tax=Georgenia halophila TaxID=620889 RepID=A0ABP8LFR2_9MICO